MSYLTGLERLNHAVFVRHLANPAIRLYTHSCLFT
jgi:hypothetical protein